MKRVTPLMLAALVGLSACSEMTDVRPNASAPAQRFDKVAGEQELVPGQIIVRFRPGAARSEIAEQHRAHKKDDMLLERTEILEVPVGEEVAIAAELSKNPNVEFAEPDYIMRVAPCEVSVNCLLPDGQFFNFKWDLYNAGSFIAPAVNPGALITTGKADADIDWVELYDKLGANYAGSAVIGILDTGIRATHALLAGKLIVGKRFLADSITAGKTNITDDNGHGSHVAGIAAGRATAATAGVAYSPNVKLVVAKVCNSAGSCPNSATANAIVWAVDNGANVINLSLGSFGGNPDGTGSAAQQAALQYALSKNVLTTCSTGNDDDDPTNGYTGGIGYPARFPECMAVGATDWGDTKASYSNYGAQIAVSAPGGDLELSPYSFIVSASRNGDNSYAFNAGTSMAAPQVAGVAALLYASGYTSAAAVRQRIIDTVDDIEAPGWDNRTGYGRVNVYRAITGLEPNAPPIVNQGGPYAGVEGSAVAFDASTSFDPNGKPVTFAWDFGDGGSAVGATPSHAFVDNGSYNVKVTVTDPANISSNKTTATSIANVAPTVNASLNASSLLSGQMLGLNGGFSDPGVIDNPWSLNVNWGFGMSNGQTNDQSAAVYFTKQVCAVGNFTVKLNVTDKDGDTGSATAGVIQVSANAISISMPAAVNNNSINSGTLPVTIYGSSTFDVSTLDLGSLRLGTNTGVEKKTNGTWMASLTSANGDAYPDLVVHFSRLSLNQAGDLTTGTTSLGLRGVMNNACTAVAGSAPIKVVP